MNSNREANSSYPILPCVAAKHPVTLGRAANAANLSLLPKPDEVKGASDMAQGLGAMADRLLRLYGAEHHVECPPVGVSLTGKAPGHRFGWYDIAKRHIYINEKGRSDHSITATLVHEMAHHIQCTGDLREGKNHLVGPGPSHGPVFHVHHWRLRAIAVAAGILRAMDKLDVQLASSARTIRGLRPRGGQYVLDVGKELAAARQRCWDLRESFETFLLDCVSLDRSTAYAYVRAYELRLPADLNFTTMRLLMRIRNDKERQHAIQDALAGVPIEVLRMRYGNVRTKQVTVRVLTPPQDEVACLLAEKARLIEQLKEIDARLETIAIKAVQPVGRRVRRVAMLANPTSPAADAADSVESDSRGLRHSSATRFDEAVSRNASASTKDAAPVPLPDTLDETEPLEANLHPLATSQDEVAVLVHRHDAALVAWAYSLAGSSLRVRAWNDPNWCLDDLVQLTRITLIVKYWRRVPVDGGFLPYAYRVLRSIRDRVYRKQKYAQDRRRRYLTTEKTRCTKRTDGTKSAARNQMSALTPQ